MKLKKLKLAGFKSFVDPTNVLFPSNRVGVVGPNGCGKSNIIDAIRWVMGEVSAKTLRGSTMSDVIFNGSSNRKPVGQASIELVFDNTDTLLTGEYSQYAELAIRRVVSRDGQSNYYLNGTRCRRKDIADVFSGTGVGARSYAIIGQNTISQMIEAKPDDLRLFIEEAANISKYKDRRSDAQGRMENTRDNLARVSDIREELGKQVLRLERQAAAAAQYNEWKQEAQKLHLESDITRWKQWHQSLKKQEVTIQNLQTEIEDLTKQRHELNDKIAQIKTKYQSANELHQQKQAIYYQLGVESARLKESIVNHNQQYQQLLANRNRVESDLKYALERLEKEESNFKILCDEVNTLTPLLTELSQKKEISERSLTQSETEKQHWQKDWDRFTQTAAISTQKLQVVQTQITHADKTIQQAEERLKQLEKDKSGLDNPIELENTFIELDKEESNLKRIWETLKQSVETTTQTILEHRQQNEQNQRNADTSQKKLQQMQGELTALNALQEAALGKKEETLKQWLRQQPFAEAPRLSQHLEVMDGWDKAVEHILGTRLQGFCVEDFATFGNLDQLTTSLSKGECTFINFSSSSEKMSSHNENLQPLLSKIQLTDRLSGIECWFNGIYIADNLEQARSLQSLLKDNESIITREGAWLGKNWLQWSQGKQVHHGILQREQAIKNLTQQIEHQKQEWENTKKVYEDGRIAATTHEGHREKLNSEVQAAHQKWMTHTAQIRIKKNQLDTLHERHKQLEKNVTDQQHSLKQAITQKEALQLEWQIASEEAKKNDESREQWNQSRETLYKKYDTCRMLVQKARDEWHACEIKLTRLKSEHSALQKNITREQENKVSLEKRREQTVARIQQMQSTDNNLSAQWKDISKKHASEATAVEESNKILKHMDEQLKNNEQTYAQLEIQINTLQTQLEKKRLDAQTLKVKCENIEEGLAPLNINIHECLEQIPEDVDIPTWEKKINALNDKIQQLGPINLAALEEFKIEFERKKELDEQYEDLVNALETLEAAIKSIDEETRLRFQETFQKINGAFQQLFPRLFGGGRATMELTQDDCLEAGVTIMAQPPGKRNSSIHLLSGGEKAMTAIALVFAIFQLNPSPFCLLDEVDAPLDDVNVGRFCAMVKEMSEQVQFIFITHNKITMELATHLSGITMHEPGVSRLVAVDIEEAVSLVS
jgi:chromosome segregation protein